MTCVAHRGILGKIVDDTQLFNIDWKQQLFTGLGTNMPINDQIETSDWAIASDSPSSNVTLPASGFDSASSSTWVTVAGGIEDDTVYIDNTIVTSGAQFNGKMTPPQTFVRQLRIRITDC